MKFKKNGDDGAKIVCILKIGTDMVKQARKFSMLETCTSFVSGADLQKIQTVK